MSWAAALAVVGSSWLAACATEPAAGTHRNTGPMAVADLLSRPAERALAEGMRAYDEAHYAQAEAQLRRAVAAGLIHPRDRATAHKLLAFIACASERLNECTSEFQAARRADPAFVLNRSEAGHPVWGVVYQRAVPPTPQLR